MRPSLLALLALATALPATAYAQTASEVERCFQNPAACHSGGGGAPAAPPVTVTRPATPAASAPDYATVLQSPEADRKKIQESLRTLDKYNGPVDGNLQSDATQKAIGDWQRGRGTPATGKLTPQEAQQLNAEASRAPIRRIEPPTQTATPAQPVPLAPAAPSAPSNADALKSLQAKLAERRKAAEPKAEAAAQTLIRDLKAYVAADGKGIAGEQFSAFAKWYADNKSVGRTVGDIAPAIDDYGEAKAGSAVSSEVNFQTKQGDASFSQCLVFAWIEGNPRKNPQVFSCDDVAAVEKWKTEQSLRSAWR